MIKLLCVSETCQPLLHASYQTRIECFRKQLRENNVNVHVATPQTLYKNAVRTNEYDVILLQRVIVPQHVLSQIKKPIIYDFDDAIYLPRDVEMTKYHVDQLLTKFSAIVSVAKIVLAGNKTLCDKSKQCGAQDVRLLRTGIDVSSFSTQSFQDPKTIVWSGSRSTLCYVEQAHSVLKNVDANVRIVCEGGGIPAWDIRSENITWTKETRVSSLANTHVGIAPMPDTDWTRGKCGFKLVQYMAAGLPVVASNVKIHREFFDECECHGFCVDTDDEMLDTIKMLLSDTQIMMRFGNANKLAAMKYFDLNTLFPTLLSAIKDASGA